MTPKFKVVVPVGGEEENRILPRVFTLKDVCNGEVQKYLRESHYDCETAGFLSATGVVLPCGYEVYEGDILDVYTADSLRNQRAEVEYHEGAWGLFLPSFEKGKFDFDAFYWKNTPYFEVYTEDGYEKRFVGYKYRGNVYTDTFDEEYRPPNVMLD